MNQRCLILYIFILLNFCLGETDDKYLYTLNKSKYDINKYILRKLQGEKKEMNENENDNQKKKKV